MSVVSIIPLQSPSMTAGFQIQPSVSPSQNTMKKRPQFHIMNRATLIGYLAKDAETRTTRNGLNFTVLTLATKASWKDRDGAWQSHSEFHRCIVWAKFGEFAATLTKGMHLQVEGELRSREYEREGVTHRIWEIRTESILKLDRAERRQEPEPAEADQTIPPDVPF